MDIFKDKKSEIDKIKRECEEEYERKHEQQIIENYHEDFSKNEKIIKPFSEIIANIVGEDTYQEFAEKTGLGHDMFYSLKKRVNKENPSYKSTIVSVCVGYNVGYEIARELLRSQGSVFNPHSSVDAAYVTILTECRGKTVEECNDLLEKMGIKKMYRLGACARRPRKSQKNL